MKRDTLFQELGQAGAQAQMRINAGESPLSVMMERCGVRFQDLWRNTLISADRLDQGIKKFHILDSAELRIVTRSLGVTVCDLLPRPVKGPLSEGVLDLLIEMVETKNHDPADGLEALEILDGLKDHANKLVQDPYSPLGRILGPQLRGGVIRFDDFDRYPDMRLRHARQLVDACCHAYFGHVHMRFSMVQQGVVLGGRDPDTRKPYRAVDLQVQRFLLDSMVEWLDMSTQMQEIAAQAIYVCNRINRGLCLMHLEERDRRESLRMLHLTPR